MAAAHRARRLLRCPEEEAPARHCRGQGGTRPGVPHRRGTRLMQAPQDKEGRRKIGGPFRREDLAAGSQGEGSDIETRIIALEALTTANLQIEWRRLYRATAPIRLSRDLLIRGVAYKVQEQAHGGLRLGIKRRLHSLFEGSDQRDGSAAAPAITLRPGTKLVREWHGHTHAVSVLNDGFEYQGE